MHNESFLSASFFQRLLNGFWQKDVLDVYAKSYLVNFTLIQTGQILNLHYMKSKHQFIKKWVTVKKSCYITYNTLITEMYKLYLKNF